MTSLVDAESVLAVDVGSVNTRVLLFDLVDGQYHLISAATAPSTAGAPFRDVREGVHNALLSLQEVTGRIFVDRDFNLILPSQSNGSGVDRLVLTFSAGGDLKLVTVGLLSDVSLQSAQRLAGTTYGYIAESIGLIDRRRAEVQIDAIVQTRPDVILIAGGTEKGSTRSVYKLVELVSLACKVMPKDSRPTVIYCGNGAISKRVKETLERETLVGMAPNIRPSIDLEDLSPAESMLARAVAKIRTRQVGGFEAYASLSSVPLTPGAYALGRMIRFLSEVSDANKGVLGVDLGASATTLAVGTAGNLSLNVFRPLGMGSGLAPVLQDSQVEEIYQWLPIDLPLDVVRDYLYQKSIYPGTLPLTEETLAIEQAAARHVLRTAAQRMMERYPSLNLAFDRVFIGGATLGQAPSAVQSLLMVLDGIQPVGVGTYLLDPHGMTQSLGAIAATNTILPVQVIESGAYLNLGTVIAPISHARAGTVILKARISYEEGADTSVEIKQGTLVPLPVRYGQVASIAFETLRGAVLDPCRPRLKSFRVVGGACGVVVDARERPLAFPSDPARRRDLLARWNQALEDRRLV